MLLKKDTGFGVWKLIPFYCFLASLNPLGFQLALKYFPHSIAIPVILIFGIGFGIVAFWAVAWLFYRFGMILGGKGSFQKIRTAYAWGYPPCIASLLFDGLGDIPEWVRTFSGAALMKVASEPMAGWQILLQIISIGFAIWSLVLCVINISEAHRFSAARSVGLMFLITFGIAFVIIVPAIIVLLVLR